ncbi:MAG TPA: hypothetical protein VLQ52_00760 [Coriobacteriia bacterium]|nr:hypothetical protein [Coriobacteriia bacterium]
MDWICLGPLALIVGLALLGAVTNRGRPKSGDQSLDPVANLGMARSFMGDKRRDSIERNQAQRRTGSRR